eukprot:gnl/MRDRNA2_/MRDRNA2_77367_c0_seq1.p1 gnl/MRDRNA2_/MRDRNA2_77367_c0~~gnl/MRDRNA2_/MRDRNA2_77367_c0_seq1.p1  ORF type:complete len:646 (-),score=99.59 gnl/MRDRNA2_/MRDRNA2_77367_c0_seq1:36-1910(-)
MPAPRTQGQEAHLTYLSRQLTVAAQGTTLISANAPQRQRWRSYLRHVPVAEHPPGHSPCRKPVLNEAALLRAANCPGTTEIQTMQRPGRTLGIRWSSESEEEEARVSRSTPGTIDATSDVASTIIDSGSSGELPDMGGSGDLDINDSNLGPSVAGERDGANALFPETSVSEHMDENSRATTVPFDSPQGSEASGKDSMLPAVQGVLTCSWQSLLHSDTALDTPPLWRSSNSRMEITPPDAASLRMHDKGQDASPEAFVFQDCKPIPMQKATALDLNDGPCHEASVAFGSLTHASAAGAAAFGAETLTPPPKFHQVRTSTSDSEAPTSTSSDQTALSIGESSKKAVAPMFIDPDFSCEPTIQQASTPPPRGHCNMTASVGDDTPSHLQDQAQAVPSFVHTVTPLPRGYEAPSISIEKETQPLISKTSASSGPQTQQDLCSSKESTSSSSKEVSLQSITIGHTLQPQEQGSTIIVRGDGWGGGEGSYKAVVTEADEKTFTIIPITGSTQWTETHVLRELCSPAPEPQPKGRAASAKKRKKSHGSSEVPKPDISNRGRRIIVIGDGWGGGHGTHEAMIMEGDSKTYTVIHTESWEETHVLRSYCRLKRCKAIASAEKGSGRKSKATD